MICKAKGEDTDEIARIVSISNKDVAELFGLNSKNAPAHPSFCTSEWIENDFEKGHEYFIYKDSGEVKGCVAFEEADLKAAYLNRLAVLPEFQNQGIGQNLVEFIIEYAGKKGMKSLGIGTIAEHEKLTEWYKKLGFTETGTKKFHHLPFTVKFMELKINE